MGKHYRKENDCLNCGATLEGKYCHECGQENLEIHESFGHMMNHAISDYFHFDHQFFHTISPLLFRPGFLTTQYMAGKRTQYLHPVKMYIFISLVYFLLVFQSNNKVEKRELIVEQPGNKKGMMAAMQKDIERDSSLTPAQKKLVKQNAGKYAGGIITVIDNDTAGNGGNTGIFSSGDTSYAQYLARQQKLPANQRDNLITSQIKKRAISYTQKYGSRAKEVFLEEFRHNIPKMMFVILPLFALILTITFSGNKKFYVEHLIYSFHLHCFFFLFLAIIMLIEMLIPQSWGVTEWLDLLTTLYVIWYIYRSLLVVYQRSKIRTVTKMAGMAAMYFVVFIFCITVVIAITGLITG